MGSAKGEEVSIMKKIPGLVCAAAVLILAGCGSGKTVNPLAPFQPQIVNQTDEFAFQITNVQSLTTTAIYTWQNTGNQASVDHSSVLTNGSASLVILDADGTQVYSSPLVASGTDATGAGTAGAWTIRVVMKGIDADQVNFRVQKQ